jgi:hypothetical protein
VVSGQSARVMLVLPDPGELDRICEAIELEGLTPRAAMDWERLQYDLHREGCPDIFVVDPRMETSAQQPIGLELRKSRHTGTALMVFSAQNGELDGLPAILGEVADVVLSPNRPVGGIRKALRMLAAADSGRERYAAVSKSLQNLTPVEQKLLEVMWNQYDRPVSRDLLLYAVWGYQPNVMTRTVDTHIKRLRKKLEGAPWQIRTVRGFGYHLSRAARGDREA